MQRLACDSAHLGAGPGIFKKERGGSCTPLQFSDAVGVGGERRGRELLGESRPGLPVKGL